MQFWKFTSLRSHSSDPFRSLLPSPRRLPPASPLVSVYLVSGTCFFFTSIFLVLGSGSKPTTLLPPPSPRYLAFVETCGCPSWEEMLLVSSKKGPGMLPNVPARAGQVPPQRTTWFQVSPVLEPAQRLYKNFL